MCGYCPIKTERSSVKLYMYTWMEVATASYMSLTHENHMIGLHGGKIIDLLSYVCIDITCSMYRRIYIKYVVNTTIWIEIYIDSNTINGSIARFGTKLIPLTRAIQMNNAYVRH